MNIANSLGYSWEDTTKLRAKEVIWGIGLCSVGVDSLLKIFYAIYRVGIYRHIGHEKWC